MSVSHNGPMEFNPARLLQSRPWLERAIGAVSPAWGLRRMQASVQRHLFEYQAARADRIYAPKTQSAPAESLRTERDRVTMLYEARDLVENFGPGKVVLARFAENVAPTEYAPQTGDRDYDLKVAEYFHEWCRKCDFEGRHSFKKLIEIAVQTRPVDGDCGFILRRMESGEIRVQLVAGDRIGNPTEVATSDTYFAGVTVDRYGRPISFRIFRVLRSGQYTDPEEVSRENFLHYSDQFRADQYRGVSDFHPVLRTARMIKEILEAEQVGVMYASQQAALIFNATGTANTRDVFSPANAITLANGQPMPQEESKYGVLKYLQRGDKVEVMPSRPGAAFTGFTDLLMQHYGLGLGIPCGVLFGTQDYKGPSVRAEFAQADRAFARHKGVLTSKVLDPARDAVILNAIANGELPLPPRQAGETIVQTMKRALRGVWRFPAKLTIDVGRESSANIDENQIGAKSLQEIAAEQDADAFERLEQNAQVAAEVHRLAEKYDVPETAIRLVGKSLPNTPAAAAAAGENTGEAAAAAQASSNPGNAPADSIAPKSDAADAADAAESEDASSEDLSRPRTVRETLDGKRTRKARSLASLLSRATRLAAVRAKLGQTTASADEIRTTLDKLNN